MRIICLQEITIKFKKYIMKNKFIKDNYYITNNEPKIFGQLILSKYKPAYQNLIISMESYEKIPSNEFP